MDGAIAFRDASHAKRPDRLVNQQLGSLSGSVSTRFRSFWDERSSLDAFSKRGCFSHGNTSRTTHVEANSNHLARPRRRPLALAAAYAALSSTLAVETMVKMCGLGRTSHYNPADREVRHQLLRFLSPRRFGRRLGDRRRREQSVRLLEARKVRPRGLPFAPAVQARSHREHHVGGHLRGII